MAKNSALGPAMGLDHDLIARAVAATDALGPLFMRHLAMGLGVGEAKVAITMKYAVQAGYMIRTGTTPQYSWTRTQKGLDTFPPGRDYVPPEIPEVELPSGGRVKGLGGSDIGKVLPTGRAMGGDAYDDPERPRS